MTTNKSQRRGFLLQSSFVHSCFPLLWLLLVVMTGSVVLSQKCLLFLAAWRGSGGCLVGLPNNLLQNHNEEE